MPTLNELEQTEAVRRALQKFSLSKEDILSIALSKKPQLYFLISVGQPYHAEDFQKSIPHLIKIICAFRREISEIVKEKIINLAPAIEITFLIGDTLQAYNTTQERLLEQETLNGRVFNIDEPKNNNYWAAKGQQWKIDLEKFIQESNPDDNNPSNIRLLLWEEFKKEAANIFRNHPDYPNEEKMWGQYKTDKKFAGVVYEKICRYLNSKLPEGEKIDITDHSKFNDFFEKSLENNSHEKNLVQYNLEELALIYGYLAKAQEATHFLLYPSDPSPPGEYCSHDKSSIGCGHVSSVKIIKDNVPIHYSETLDSIKNYYNQNNLDHAPTRPIQQPPFYVENRRDPNGESYTEKIDAHFSNNNFCYITGELKSGKSQVAADYFLHYLKKNQPAIWIDDKNDKGSFEKIVSKKIELYFGVKLGNMSAEFLLGFLVDYLAKDDKPLLIIIDSIIRDFKKLATRFKKIKWLFLTKNSAEECNIYIPEVFNLHDDSSIKQLLGPPYINTEKTIEFLKEKPVSEFSNTISRLKQGEDISFLIKNFSPPLKNENFVGRAHEFEKISSLMAKKNLVGVYGMAGIGKTSLLDEWVRRNHQQYQHILRIRSEDLDKAIKTLEEFCRQKNLSLTPSSSKNKEMKIQNILNQILNWREQESFLFIFDNIVQREPGLECSDKKKFFLEEFSAKQSRCNILISSQTQLFQHAIELHSFSEEDSRTCMRQLLGVPHLDPIICDGLAKILGHHPLALTITCSLIKEGTTDHNFNEAIRSFITTFQEQAATSFLEHRTPTYETNIAILYSKVMAHIKQTHGPEIFNLTQKIVLCLAYLDPDGVSRDFLIDAINTSENLDQPVSVLKRLSLVSESTDSLSEHRLIRKVSRSREEKLKKKEILISIDEAIPDQVLSFTHPTLIAAKEGSIDALEDIHNSLGNESFKQVTYYSPKEGFGDSIISYAREFNHGNSVNTFLNMPHREEAKVFIQLWDSVKNDDSTSIKNLIQTAKDHVLVALETRNDYDETPLELAVRNSSDHTVSILVEAVDKNLNMCAYVLHKLSSNSDNKALAIARYFFRIDNAYFYTLLNSEDRAGMTPLALAIQEEKIELIKFLLETSPHQWISLPLWCNHRKHHITHLICMSANPTTINQCFIHHNIILDFFRDKDCDGKTPFMLALQVRDENFVRFLLNDASLRNDMDFLLHQDKHGNMPLHHASSGQYCNKIVAIIDILFKYSSHCFYKNLKHQNTQGYTPLMLAAKNGFGDLVNCFLSKIYALPNTASQGLRSQHFKEYISWPIDQDHNNVLHLICEHSDQVTIIGSFYNQSSEQFFCLLRQARRDSKTPADIAFEKYRTRICSFFEYTLARNHPNEFFRCLSKDTANHAMQNQQAHSNNFFWHVELMLQTPLRNQKVNNFLTPSITAIKLGLLDKISFLKDIDEKDLSSQDGHGNTILHHVLAGPTSIEGLKKFFGLHQKLDVNISNHGGWTPIMIAARYNHPEAIKLLKERGADVNAKNRDGNTALHFAAKRGYITIIILLLTYPEIDKNPINKNNETPRCLAEKNNHFEIMALLPAEREPTSHSYLQIRLTAGATG